MGPPALQWGCLAKDAVFKALQREGSVLDGAFMENSILQKNAFSVDQTCVKTARTTLCCTFT